MEKWVLKKETLRKCLPGVLILFIVLICYIPAMQSGYIWDDDRYVTENPVLTDGSGLARIWLELGATIQYYPMVFTTFWIEHQLWGLNPAGYHVVNVLLHALAGVLIWRILGCLGVPCAWMAAAVFAVHPVHVESVAWVTERKNVLSGVFYLSSMLFYISDIRSDLPAKKDGTDSGIISQYLSDRYHYILALVLYTFALLSKTVACTMPVAILLILWWKRERISLRDCASLVPFFILGAAAGLITLYMEKYNVRAEGPEWNFSFIDRILIAGRALWFYAAKLIWPHPLIFNYPKWQIDPYTWWQYLFPIGSGVVLIILFIFRKRIGKSPLAAGLFFTVTLFPALGFFNVYPMRYSFVADHFQYLASIGLIALLVSAVSMKLKAKLSKPVLSSLGALVIAVFGTVTWQQCHAYRDLETIWRDTLAKNPASWMAHNNLGTTLVDKGDIDEAIIHYQAVLRLKPDHYRAQVNLGNAFFRKRKFDLAEDHYSAAIRLAPDFVPPYIRIGEIRLRQGKIDEAIDRLTLAVDMSPNLVKARYYLAMALFEKGSINAAIDHLEKALQVQPGSADIHNILGIALARQNRLDEAIPHLKKALEIDPDFEEARYNLKLVMDKAGKGESNR